MIRSVPARFGLACSLAVSAFAFSGAASAQEGVAIKNLLGNVGIIPKQKEYIHYRERAPLVVPPKADLRTPAARNAAAANPQWPTDPDVAARRRRAAEEQTPVTWSENRRMLDDNTTRLSARELQRGRVANAGEGPAMNRGLGDTRESTLLSPLEMMMGIKRDSDEPGAPAVEPTRRALTDPPTGMRRTSSGKVAEKDFAPRIDQQQYDASPMNWLTRRFSSSDDD